MDFDPRDYDSRDDERTPRRRVGEAAPAPAIAIVMTTGANLGRARGTAITMTHGRSDAVLEANGKDQTGMEADAIMIPVGPNAIVRVENAIVSVGRIHSPPSLAARARARARSRP